jgi:putative nucleotidyltransferase with HDIG domain
MKRVMERYVPQPLIAIVVAVLAFVCLSVSWVVTPLPANSTGAEIHTILTLVLLVTALLTYHFPIHIRLSSKVYMCGVVFFLMASLLPVPLAIAAVGLSTVAGELSVRSRTGNYPSDIVTIAGRSALIAAATSAVAHIPVFGGTAGSLTFVAAAITMWVCEHLTYPLIYYPVTREQPIRIIKVLIREGGLIEASQLLVGLLGVIAASQQLWSLALLLLPTVLVYFSFKRARELDDGTRKTIEFIADTVDLRDPYTGGHSRRVTEFVGGILTELGKTGPEVDLIIWAARVHDIGKIAVPDGVLNKPGALTDEERTIMESHSERGAEFLSKYPQFQRGVEIVLHHHERWDGNGYPHRLRENAIPFGARIIAVADSYDAMTSDRPYRRGMSPQRAAAILREGRGMQWEGTVVDAFIRSVSHLLDADEKHGLHLVPPAEHPAPAALA